MFNFLFILESVNGNVDERYSYYEFVSTSGDVDHTEGKLDFKLKISIPQSIKNVSKQILNIECSKFVLDNSKVYAQSYSEIERYKYVAPQNRIINISEGKDLICLSNKLL